MDAERVQAKSGSFLTGHWLLLARLAWVFLAGLMVVTFVASLSVFWDKALQVCTATSGCAEQSLLTPGDVLRLKALGLPLSAWALYNVGQRVLSLFVFSIVAVVIFIRRPADPMALLTSLFLVTWGATNGNLTDVLVAVQPAWWLVSGLRKFLAAVGLALFLYLFPNGAFVPRWTRWILAAWAVVTIPLSFAPDSPLSLFRMPVIVIAAVFILAYGSMLVAQFYRYRHVSTLIERQQTRWVVFGVAVVIVGFLVAPVVLALNQGQGSSISWLRLFQDISTFGLFLVLPITIGIAILRSHLFDIDVIIRRTVTYGVLTALLLAVYFGGVVILQQVFVALTGQRQELAIIISTLAIAALSVPLRNRIQSVIDRRFFRRKYNSQQVLESFARMVRDEVDTTQLTTHFMDVVDEALQPTQVTVWLRERADSRTRVDRP